MLHFGINQFSTRKNKNNDDNSLFSFDMTTEFFIPHYFQGNPSEPIIFFVIRPKKFLP